MNERKPEHGTLSAYISGFVLSLIFTLIPYYLVVEKVVTGNMLLATILGFAILQLLTQVLLFLHLGRERKPKWQTGFLVATIGAVFVVTVGSIWIMNHLQHANMTPTQTADKVSEGEAVHQIGGEPTGTCPGDTGVTHKVVLGNDTMTPLHTKAKLCDSLMIINQSDSVRAIMFGTYEHMGTYAGEAALSIREGRNKLIKLTEPGTYQFHDHQNPEVTGEFTVTPR